MQAQNSMEKETTREERKDRLSELRKIIERRRSRLEFIEGRIPPNLTEVRKRAHERRSARIERAAKKLRQELSERPKVDRDEDREQREARRRRIKEAIERKINRIRGA